MIDVKKAIAIAREQAAEFLPGSASFQLEEIERETYQGRNVWSITLSLPDTSPLVALSGRRQYKRFLVDVETGNFVAMKLRELATP